VPSLNENRILERWSGGVRLLQASPPCGAVRSELRAAIDTPRVPFQVAAQELAWGLKFSATATLDIEELPNGINAAQRDGYGLTPAECMRSCVT
jgi:hypothetical protein